MTRKHFNAIAAALAAQRASLPADAFRALVNQIADVCKSSNAAFDRDRFADACGAR